MIAIKEGRGFITSSKDGNLRGRRSDGFFVDDTRHLSTFTVDLAKPKTILMSSSAPSSYSALFSLTNAADDDIPAMALGVQRFRTVDDDSFVEHIDITNFGKTALDTSLLLDVGADFMDMFEVRDVVPRGQLPQTMHIAIESNGITFVSERLPDLVRRTTLRTQPEVDWTIVEDSARGSWSLECLPGETVTLQVAVDASPTRSSRAGRSDIARRHDKWTASTARITTDNEILNRGLAAATTDLLTLETKFDDEPIVAAGVPWYVAPFGRDALITGYETLILRPQIARDALLYLGNRQARREDPSTDAQPGKILHEMRRGDLACAGLIPQTPYYGTADATPLFIILLAEYWRWTRDIETLRKLAPAMEKCLRWMDDFGDADGDGFIEYHRSAPDGLINQGWKDSSDAVVHSDGSLAQGPIALCEVQGYAYMARRCAAALFRGLGRNEEASHLEERAKDLKNRFHEAFWMPREGFYALALDGAKRQVESITSNPGHCLFSGIVAEEHAGQVVARLLAPDMFSGWGIRTLSSASSSYNPMSYHDGSVWPHDNALILVGLRRYGFQGEVEQVATALFDLVAFSPDARLPELICGFDRDEGPYVHYPVACVPQAWSAGAIFLMLQTLLGVTPDETDGGTERLIPLPTWLGKVELQSAPAHHRGASTTFIRG